MILFQRAHYLMKTYPRQFWYLILGMLVNSIGMGMIWPFLTIYMRQQLGVPLSTVTALLTLDSVMSILSSFLAGPIADRFGRKWVMALSLFMAGATYTALSQAGTLWMFAVLMALRGAFLPLYRIGADAMVADMIPQERRADAYSISRTINNIGVAIGPSVGGFVAAASYANAFLIAAICLIFFGLLVATVMHETLPEKLAVEDPAAKPKEDLGYNHVIHNIPFLWFIFAFSMTIMGSSLVFILLGVYTKENYQMPENHLGFIMAINAVMVVLFQYIITQTTKRYSSWSMLALGSMVYAVGIGSIALGSSFIHFAISMVILTVGELIVMPTSTSLAANLAPADMRGRYMSMYWLGWSLTHGLGPLFGGFLNDIISPKSIWYGGAAWCAMASIIFVILARYISRQKQQYGGPQPVNMAS